MIGRLAINGTDYDTRQDVGSVTYNLESIKNDPSAAVPTSVAAVCMGVQNFVHVGKDWVALDGILQRLDTEAQAMFANGVRHQSTASKLW